jgi:hypothetical protein
VLNLGLNSLRKLIIDLAESEKMRRNITRNYDYDSLTKIRLSVFNTAFNGFIKMQTPHKSGVWNKSAFLTVLNPDLNVVINKPNPFVPLSKNIDKNWLLHIEPPGYIKKLKLDDEKVMEKFSRVYTCAPHLYEQGGRYIASPPYVHWHLALSSYTNDKSNVVYDFDFMSSPPAIPEKEYSLVTIASKMNHLPGHKLRADFISAVCDAGIDIQLYGTDNWSKYKQYKGRAIYGKWPIYSKSRFALAIENEVSPLYWTEKFTDAILCYAMPIYYGSPDIGKYFPKGSYIEIDITKKSAVNDLQDIINSDYYEKNLPALIEARNLIISKHNMFNFLDNEASALSPIS